MNKIRDVEKLNEVELQNNVSLQASWHQAYRASNYVFVGGLPFALTEGDLETVMAQFGVVTDLMLQRDEDGKSKGFGWVAFADWRSTVLAVDNLNGVVLSGRKLGCDHALNYTPPDPAKGGKTWWEQKQKALRKAQKKERKKKEKKRAKKEAKKEEVAGGGLMMRDVEKLVKLEDGSMGIVKRE